jgi:predicted nucleic acid-binding protein
MIVPDTNILSTFARVGRLELLFAVAETEALHLCPAVVQEVEAGLRKGLGFLQPIADGVTSGAKFYALNLTNEEMLFAATLPASLNAGERECIAVCAKRSGAKLLTNDKRARNYCDTHQLFCLDLKQILRRLWQASHCAKEEVRSLIKDIETSEPGMAIKGKDEIFR